MIKLTGLKLFLQPKEHLVGLDLGVSSIKAVRLVRREKRLVLVGAEMKEIPEADEGAAREKRILSALSELVREMDLRRSRFFVCFNSRETGVRSITAPPMPKGELKEAMRIESQGFFPFPIDESVLDFEPLGPVTEKGAPRIRAAVAVSPKRTVNEIIALLARAGIQPASLTPVPAALAKWAEVSGRAVSQSRCLLDIGDRQTEVLILKEAKLVFSRKIPLGGRDFTQAMMGVLVSDRGKVQLSWDEAEKIKREVGIPGPGESKNIEDKISSVQLASMLRTPLEQLNSEIDRCLDYYREESGGEREESLTLLGRGANLKGLAETLSGELGMKVETGNLLAGSGIEAQVVMPEEGLGAYAGALGAVLTLGQGINLLPPEIKEKTQRTVKRATFQSAVAAAVLILAFLYIGMQIQLANFEKRIHAAQIELDSLRSELSLAREEILAANLLASEPYWEDVLKEIGSLTPSSASLTQMSLKDGKITLKGTLASADKEAMLSDFIQRLENGIFKNVRLVTTRGVSDTAKAEFEIECWTE